MNNINLVRMDIIDDVSLGIFVKEHKKTYYLKKFKKIIIVMSLFLLKI